MFLDGMPGIECSPVEDASAHKAKEGAPCEAMEGLWDSACFVGDRPSRVDIRIRTTHLALGDPLKVTGTFEYIRSILVLSDTTLTPSVYHIRMIEFWLEYFKEKHTTTSAPLISFFSLSNPRFAC